MKNTPNRTKTPSGRSFATVATSMRRAPCRTPRRLTAAKNAKTARIITVCATPVPIPGKNALIPFTKPFAMAACACAASSQRSTPLRYPTKGPKTVPTYAYGPPVSFTRLPASAKQSTMSPKATAQTRYASHAAEPSPPAMIAG